MKLDTTNVIEISDGEIIGITAFQNDEKGNLEAEELFKKLVEEDCVAENEPTDEDELEQILSDGIYQNYGYEIHIVSSNFSGSLKKLPQI